MKRHRSTYPLAAGVPLVTGLVSGALLAWWWDELPDPVATHWSGSSADGFTALAHVPWLFVGLVTFTWLMTAIVAAISAPARAVTGFSTWLVTFCAALVLPSLEAQRGVRDATAVGFQFSWFGIGLAISTVATMLVVAVTRPDREAGSVPAHPVAPAPAGSADWQGIASGKGLIVTALIMGIVGVVLGVLADWWLGLGLALLAIPLLGLARWRVSADDAGITARAALPFVTIRVPSQDITGAEIVDVSPLGQFGGWGIRSGPMASLAIVVRAGDAVLVHRKDRRPFLVTIDDAEGFAAVIMRSVAT